MSLSKVFALTAVLFLEALAAGQNPPPLPAGALARMGSNLSGQEPHPGGGHTLPLTHLAFTPDGSQLVTCSKDGTTRLWEAATGKELRVMKTSQDVVVAVALSPDGQHVAAADAGGAIRIFEKPTGKVLRELKGPALAVLAWTQDGKALIAAGRGGQVRLWTGNTKSEYPLYKGQDKEGSFVVLAPGGQWLACSQYGNFPGVGGAALQVRHAASGRLVHELDLAAPETKGDTTMQTICWAAAFSPDGKYLATSQSVRTLSGIRSQLSGHRLRLWEIVTGREVLALDNVRVAPNLLAFSRNGRFLAYTTADGLTKGGKIWGEQYVILLDTLTRGEVARLQPEMGMLTALALAPSAHGLAAAGADPMAILWDLAKFQQASARAGPTVATALAPQEVAAHWADLADADAAKAYQSLARMILEGDHAVVYLRERLRPVPRLDARQIEAWIEELDSEQFSVRQKAMLKLEKAGTLAEAHLRKAQEGQASLEFRRRLELLMQKIDRALPPAQELQALRALTILERAASPAARELLATIAQGAPEARLTRQARWALERWPLR